MTAKEKLHERIEALSEEDAQRLLTLVEGGADEWGSLAKLHESTTAETMRRLATEEQAAGHDPW